MTRWFGSALLVATLGVASSALAVPMKLNPAHKAKYSDGVKKQNAGDYAVALASFESIPVADRSYDARLHIATCKARLNRMKDAAADLDEIINLAKNDKLSPSERDAIVDTAKSDLDQLNLEIPRLSITTTARSVGLTVKVDGAVVKAPYNGTLDPGAHTVTANRGEEEVFKRDVSAERNGKYVIEIDNAPTAVVAPAPKVEPPPPVLERPAGAPVTAYIAMGAGIAFGALSVVGFVSRGSAYDDYKASCDTRLGCDDGLRSTVSTWQTVAFASAAVSVASFGVGIYLFAKPRTTTTAALTVTPSSIQLIARF
jgi:hypothetical protein